MNTFIFIGVHAWLKIRKQTENKPLQTRNGSEAFEPFGKLREEYGGALGRMVTERAEANESIVTYCRLRKAIVGKKLKIFHLPVLTKSAVISSFPQAYCLRQLLLMKLHPPKKRLKQKSN